MVTTGTSSGISPHIQIVAIATSLTLIAVLGALWYQKRNRNAVPKIWEPAGKVKRICLYPLKSGKAVDLKKAECTEYGLKHVPENQETFQLRDRALLVYQEGTNEFKNANSYPKLLFIQVSAHDKDHYAVTAPNMQTLYVKIPSESEKNKGGQISLHEHEKIYRLDCGNEAANWISRYVLAKDSGLRLGYHDGAHRRDITKNWKGFVKAYKNLNNDTTGMYSDLTSYMLLNQASVDELNSRIPDASITANHFRPNIIVESNNSTPWAEDNWEWIRIGDAVFRSCKPCTRCMLTTLNPETGIREKNREPLRTLETYRRLKDLAGLPGIEIEGKLTVMGVHLGLFNPGFINVNDEIYVGKQ